MLDDLSDSFLLQASVGCGDSLSGVVNIADLILDESPRNGIFSAPNVLSQIVSQDSPVIAGQIETPDGKVLPLTIGQTDIGNGKPPPYIHISDDPSVISRHITITTVQTNDGKFRALLKVNHAHGKVLLGGSVIRPDTMYPIVDDDEIVVGDGVRFKLRLNNQSPATRARHSIGAPTPYYVAAPNSDEIHESEEREREEKRRHFQDRLTPPNDDAFILQLATAADSNPEANPPISVVHQMGDTCPYSSGRESTSQVVAPAASIQSPCEFMPTADPPQDPLPSVDYLEDEILDSGTPVQDKQERTGNASGAGDTPPATSHEDDRVSDGIMSEGTEPPGDLNDGNQDIAGTMSQKVGISAPQLSQLAEGEPSSLMDRLKQKRALADVSNMDESLSQPKQKARKQNAEEEGLRVSGRRSGRNSAGPVSPAGSFSGGPKKLTLLKTAVEVDKSTESAVLSVGAKLESKWSDKVDGLVTGSIVRTTKFLCAINRGLAVFPKSILSDIKTHKALPPTDRPELWLQDPEGEKKYSFVLRDSILRARKRPLLQGYEVYCFKNSIGEFSSDELKDLITTAGGKMMARLPKELPDDVILIGSEANAAAARAVGAKSINKIEFLVDACIKQEIRSDFAKIFL